MKVWIIGCFGMMGMIVLSILYRFMVHYRLDNIPTKQTSRLFRTKLTQFKQKELRKSLVYLAIGMMGVITVIAFSLLQVFQLETRMQGLRTDNRSLQGEVRTMKKKTQVTTLLADYPVSGLDLNDQLVVSNQTIDEKEQLEKKVSKQLLPYIDDAKLVFSSSSESDSLTLLLTGSVQASNANLVILGQNITAFMKEVEGVKKITEVHVNMNDREGNDLYKGTYIRNDQGHFTFQSELRKGKG
ncbi:hypothetical protein P7E02_03610 [Enterococcus hulanensis]|uniref:hypothetical protein n=1 Tax=Enterococcus hulanensis TaxID=2559929 RepID=UPI0028914B7A|nr:hypothetical protein [Enterococcus hulanensis]MDT2658938.1 hypothetical protein [Enterococcus hulanensis]